MPEKEQIHIRNLVAACSAICVFGLAFGMTYPLLSLIMESRGVSPGMIGINSAMMPIGILMFSSVIPYLARRYGGRNIAAIAAVITSILILAYKAFDHLEAWFVIRMLQGMSISTLFVLSEAWIVRFAGSRHRGKIIALYGSVLSASFGAGPALVSWIGIDGWMPFVVGSVIIVLGIFPVFLLKEDLSEPKEEARAAGIFEFAPKAPMLMACVFAFAILDAATLSLLPVYGIENGLDISTSALILTALIVGNTVLQFPIGWLADKYPHRAVLAGCAFVTVVMLMILPWVMATALMWPVVITAGAAGYGIYTVSLTSLGSRFNGIQLVNGSAAFAAMWGVGALIGSLSGGWSMTLFGPHGLPYHLALVYLILVIGLAMRGYQTKR